MPERWKPAVTVAAIMARGDRLCVVEEEIDGRLVYNQPAGHWEPGESLADACAREALEETAWRFAPTHLLGVYRWEYRDAAGTFLRFAFVGDAVGQEPARRPDAEIRQVLWLTPAEIEALEPRHRSPLVMACVRDYVAGRRYPLDVIRHY